MGALEYGTGTAPGTTRTPFEQADQALRDRWERERWPKERFEISFKSSWGACGEAMMVLDVRGVEDMSWEHDAGAHRVRFTCTFSTLKSIQDAMCSVSVIEPRCRRLPGRVVEEGAS